jgi:hypothetical protein
MRTVLFLLFFLFAGYGLFMVANDPYRTALPMEVDDLSPIAPQLAKLPTEDRDLVLEYLKRSNGDVLPAQFADPDNPLTARTFREAIALQKVHRVKMVAERGRMQALEAKRDARLKPLRDALGLKLVKRELLSEAEIYATPQVDEWGRAKPVVVPPDARKVPVLTYRLTNRSARAITGFKGSAEIPGDFLPLMECWIDETRTLAPGEYHDARCGDVSKIPSAQQVAFVTLPAAQVVLRWYPAEVRFADGDVLKADRYAQD